MNKESLYEPHNRVVDRVNGGIRYREMCVNRLSEIHILVEEGHLFTARKILICLLLALMLPVEMRSVAIGTKVLTKGKGRGFNSIRFCNTILNDFPSKAFTKATQYAIHRSCRCAGNDSETKLQLMA